MASPSELPQGSPSLREFLLLQTKYGYGGPEESPRKEKDGSTTIEFEQGPWRFQDRYFTGEADHHYIGQEVVYLLGKPFWVVNYEGWVKEGIDPEEAYSFLKEMLKSPNPDFPLRGPESATVGRFDYELIDDGGIAGTPLSLERFRVKETILRDIDEEDGIGEIYWATFSGGLI